jgi:hypothetical protein
MGFAKVVMGLGGVRIEPGGFFKLGQPAFQIAWLREQGAGYSIHIGGRIVSDGLLAVRRRLGLCRRSL